MSESVNDRLYGQGLLKSAAPTPAGILCERFTFPPFSVLNAREGDWQKRKRAWLRLGIEGEVGRANNLLDRSSTIAREMGKIDENDPEAVKQWNKERRASGQGRSVSPGGGAMPAADYSTRQRGDGRGAAIQAAGRAQNLTLNAKDEEGYAESTRKVARAGSTTSIFDPVLCELLYRWFCPLGGQAVDPFAGGSVRGIIGHVLGNKYWGSELREEQVEANRAQAELILPDNKPTWVIGDSRKTLQDSPEADFVLSCPPYGDLEKYSNHPDDLSAMPLPDFRAAYKEVIQKTADRMKEDSFAAWVVGDYRDENGNYTNFTGGTVSLFKQAGLHLYNEAILVTAVASLSLRVSSWFDVSRKLGKGHQNIYVFVKGNGMKAAKKVIASYKEAE